MDIIQSKPNANYYEDEISFFEFHICVIGIDEAGLNLARLFATKYQTIGFDANSERIDELAKSNKSKSLTFTSNLEDIRGCNFYLLSDSTSEDLINAGKVVGNVIKNGDFVVLDQTDFTEIKKDHLIPEIESISGLKYDEDFFGAERPEVAVKNEENREVSKIVHALFSSIITAKIS